MTIHRECSSYPLLLAVGLGIACVAVVSSINDRSQRVRPAAAPDRLIDYVNTLIGTDNGGNTYPGAVAPFGMAQLSPDTSEGSVGYAYTDHEIHGFSLTHMSGVGCAACGDVAVMPSTGPILPRVDEYKSGFQHSSETTKPGYYRVHLDRPNVDVELTASTHCGVARITFPEGGGNLLLPISHTLTHTYGASVRILDNRTIQGQVTSQSFCGAGQRYTVYFALRFDKPFDAAGVWDGDSVHSGQTTAAQNTENDQPVGAYASFTGREVTASVGISYVDIAGAVRNLQSEIGDQSFDSVMAGTQAAWEKMLGRIGVEGGAATDRTKFYTALYHSMLMPNVFSDVDGRYIGFDNKIHTVPQGHAVYANYSGWDIYRDEVSLLSLLVPDRVADMCQSIVYMYEQGGWIDRWPQNNTYTNVMCGSPLTTMISTAWEYGIHGFDIKTAYLGMLKDATQPAPPNEPYQGESNITQLDKLGYIPDDLEGYGAVSQTEEDCYAYSALAYVADALGHKADAQMLRRRSLYYRNVFDNSTKFMRPRLQSGDWLTPFDPKMQEPHYVEGSGWQYLWLVPHDERGLITLIGGDDAFNAKLSSFFARPPKAWDPRYYNPQNEPDLEAPLLFDYSRAPWLTQDVVRLHLSSVYGTGPDGIPGNDDCGVMSAWYVLGALGIYPVDPASATFELCSPVFTRATIHIGSPYRGNQISIVADQTSPANEYIENARVNDRKWDKPWIPVSVLTAGPSMQFEMGASPNMSWGSKESDRPPSLSDNDPLTPSPSIDPPGGTAGDTFQITDTDPRVRIRYTLDGSSPTAQSTLYAGAVTTSSCADVRAQAFEPGHAPSVVSTAFFGRALPPGNGDGLAATYFPNIDLTGTPKTRVDHTLDFGWPDNKPSPDIGPNNWSARWTGSLTTPFGGTYHFRTISDDGIRVWFDGKLVIDDWNMHSPTSDSFTVTCTADTRYSIKIEYFQGNGGTECRLFWRCPCFQEQIVGQGFLFSTER